MTPINMTTAELRDRAAELRKVLAATEAEIEVREKVADWPTAQYVWGEVAGIEGIESSDYAPPEGALLWVRDPADGMYATSGSDEWWAGEEDSYFKTATPVTLVPTAEWDAMVEAWGGRNVSHGHAVAFTYAVTTAIYAAKEVQG